MDVVFNISNWENVEELSRMVSLNVEGCENVQNIFHHDNFPSPLMWNNYLILFISGDEDGNSMVQCNWILVFAPIYSKNLIQF